MRIVYIHQYFKTPEEGGAIRSYHLAKKLVEAGHDVEMVTAHNSNMYNKVTIEGIIIHYLPVSYYNLFGFAKRVFSFLKFVYLAYRRIKQIERIDLIYATSTPLTVGWLALKIKKKLGIPYLFEVRDLWPDAPIQMGEVKNGILVKGLFKLEKSIYNNSEGVIALSPPVKSIIETRTNNKVFLIPNFADIGFFNHWVNDIEFTKSVKHGNDFLVVYAGAIGKVNNLENLIDLADSCLRKNLPVKFLIIGEGAYLNCLKIQSEQRLLTNIHFVPQQNKHNLRKYLHTADAAYISFAKAGILETSSPNKLFDALACGKLIIYNKGGWIKDLIETNQCGFYADPENPDQSSKKLASFILDAEKLKAYQQNALKSAKQFSKEKLLNEFIILVESVWEEQPSNTNL
jgi:glycosyltransferase involved in cell wall biosynthesis